MTLSTFGIIGYGHFGEFLSGSLAEHGQVLVSDIDDTKPLAGPNGVRRAELDELGQSDLVILAVPFSALEAAVKEVRQHLSIDTIVMDVVSTKARSTTVLEEMLEDHPNVVASHPLFGPPSMEKIEAGQRLVVTYEKGPRAEELARFLRGTLGLDVYRLTPEEHDRAMAYMQALPFFIARALNELHPPDILNRDLLALPSYAKLVSIAEIEEHHSGEMFDTSQRSNPYANEAREELLRVLTELHEKIRGEGTL